MFQRNQVTRSDRGRTDTTDAAPSTTVASNKIIAGIAALGIVLFGTVAFAQHEQHGRIARQDAETAREGSAPGPAARRGEPATLDVGEAGAALEGRLWQAGRACGTNLPAGTSVHVRANVQPSGLIDGVTVLHGIRDAGLSACIADTLNGTAVTPFRGQGGTIEPELVVSSH